MTLYRMVNGRESEGLASGDVTLFQPVIDHYVSCVCTYTEVASYCRAWRSWTPFTFKQGTQQSHIYGASTCTDTIAIIPMILPLYVHKSFDLRLLFPLQCRHTYIYLEETLLR